jgi:gamma-glutamylcyclotransferase (GGCT)/AIG2-like uncharacterized protein YtfP
MRKLQAPPVERNRGTSTMFERLAAYGTLMTGEPNRLSPAVRRRMVSQGPCLIPGRLFRVRNPGGLDYPALVAAPRQTVPAELFSLPVADLKAIDAYEDFRPAAPHQSTYLRRRLIAQTVCGPVRAWVYVWNRPITGLKPVPGNAWARSRASPALKPAKTTQRANL